MPPGKTGTSQVELAMRVKDSTQAKGDAMKMDLLQKEFNSKPRQNVDSLTVKVDLNAHSMKRINAHFQSFERTWMKNSLTPTFDSVDFIKYIYTCFDMRVKSQSESLREYSKVSKRVKIPALLYLVMQQVGYVHIKDLGLVLSPISIIDESSRLSVSQVDEISLKLQELENLGHEMARGIPIGDGNQDFMLMQVVDESVMTHDPKIHPVYAFLRSFLTMEDIVKLIIPRIIYQSVDEYDIAYESLVRSRDV